MRLAITGISGYLGQRLTRQIAAELEQGSSDVEFVLGIDVRSPAATLPDPHYDFALCDVRDSEMQTLFRRHRIDTALHLAYALNPLRDRMVEYGIDVEGSKNFLEACEHADTERIVVVSSGTAYGAHPDHRMLTEDAPLRAMESDFDYARNKAIVEDVCQWYLVNHPGVKMTILRPSVLIGPHIDNYISRNLSRKRPIMVSGHDPEFQFLHEDDAAGAVRAVISSDVEGPVNLAADGVVRLSEAAELLGTTPLRLPTAVVYPLTALLWRIGRSEAPPAYLDFVRYPWTLANGRMKDELGYQPRHSSREAFLDFARARGLVASGLEPARA